MSAKKLVLFDDATISLFELAEIVDFLEINHLVVTSQLTTVNVSVAADLPVQVKYNKNMSCTEIGLMKVIKNSFLPNSPAFIVQGIFVTSDSVRYSEY